MGFREGVDGLTVHRGHLRHPRFRGVYTLGECVTESYPSTWEGPETVRSVVLLYWGSFPRAGTDGPPLRLAGADLGDAHPRTPPPPGVARGPGRPGRRRLRDGADLPSQRRTRLRPPLLPQRRPHRAGHLRRGGRGLPRTEMEERRFRRGGADPIQLGRTELRGRPSRKTGRCPFVRIVEGIRAPPYIELVLVRSSSWREKLQRGLSGAGFEVYESDAVADPAKQTTLGARGMSNQ